MVLALTSRIKSSCMALFIVMVMAGAAYADSSFLTENAATIGKKKSTMYVDGFYGMGREREGMFGNTHEVDTRLYYGQKEDLDLIWDFPYFFQEVNGRVTQENSTIGDFRFLVKKSLFKDESHNVSVMPGLKLPTGDVSMGFGDGKTTFGAYMLGAKEYDPFMFNVNLGYWRFMRTNNPQGHIFSLSGGVVYRIHQRLAATADLRVESNPYKNATGSFMSVAGGLIYPYSYDIDMRLGVKMGMSGAEEGLTIMPSIQIKF